MKPYRKSHENRARRAKSLTEVDRALWHAATRSVQPIHPRGLDPGSRRAIPEIQQFGVNDDAAPETKKVGAPKKALISTVAPTPEPGNIDYRTSRRLRRGQLEVEARLDLHGFTQREAYQQLCDFVQRCQRNDQRSVLVITGRGTRSEGILRSMVPRWLAGPELGTKVSSYAVAHIRHGGEGAFYVLLRKHPERHSDTAKLTSRRRSARE